MLYLLDTCSYLRLAFSIHPLLGNVYCIAPEVAKVTSDVHTEWDKQPKLQTKFHWAGEDQYVRNRSTNLVRLTGKQPTEIIQMRRNIRAHSETRVAAIKAANYTLPSPTDCAVLAYTFVLSENGTAAKAISDDGGMGCIANDLQIPCGTTLDLLNRMYIAKTQTINQIVALAKYLDYIDDLPNNWRVHGPAFFGIRLP